VKKEYKRDRELEEKATISRPRSTKGPGRLEGTGAFFVPDGIVCHVVGAWNEAIPFVSRRTGSDSERPHTRTEGKEADGCNLTDNLMRRREKVTVKKRRAEHLNGFRPSL